SILPNHQTKSKKRETNVSLFFYVSSLLFKKAILRIKPVYLVRLTADFLKMAAKSSSVSSVHCCLSYSSNCGLGLNNGWLCGVAKRFQGHTSWHTSQPYIQSSIMPLNCVGMASFNSIVRYEMHLLPLTI